jgi:DNA-binding CsgD family transcriptional regulator
LDLTEQNLKNQPNIRLFCKSKILRVDHLLMENKLQEAKKTLQEVDKNYDYFKDDIRLVNLFSFYNAKLYYSLQDYKVSANWYNDVIVTYQMLYNTNRNSVVKKAEAKYINKTKILELAQAKKDNQNQRNQKYLGFSLAIISGLGLLFAFGTFKYRQREQLAKNELLEKQKTEAELYGKLQEQVAKRLNLEIEIEMQQKELLQKQLMSSALQMERKNKIMHDLKLTISKTETIAKNIEVRNINKIIEAGFAIDDDFDTFKMNFENVYPSFFTRLIQKAEGELSQLDLKYCAYINMGLTSKEIANLLNVEYTSVRMAKYRLKQKLLLDKQSDLTLFINSVA